MPVVFGTVQQATLVILWRLNPPVVGFSGYECWESSARPSKDVPASSDSASSSASCLVHVAD